MEIVRLAAGEFLVGEWPDVARFNQDDTIGILDFAFDQQKCFLGN